jgi:hypothetical protein
MVQERYRVVAHEFFDLLEEGLDPREFDVLVKALMRGGPPFTEEERVIDAKADAIPGAKELWARMWRIERGYVLMESMKR